MYYFQLTNYGLLGLLLHRLNESLVRELIQTFSNPIVAKFTNLILRDITSQ